MSWHFSVVKFKHLSWIKCAYCGKQINAGDRVSGRNLALTDAGIGPAMRYFCDKECARKWYESREPEQEMDAELNAYIKNPPRSREGEAQ